MQPLKYIQKTLVLQHDQSDCGVACLFSLIKYYGGSGSLERIRLLSGTNTAGTTLLGLYQAANSLGFTAEGCEAGIKALSEHGKPCILHVTIDNSMQHYVVCYGLAPSLPGHKGTDGEVFLIGDPSKGMRYYTKEELDAIWQSKTCLILEPHDGFVKVKEQSRAKLNWIKNLLKEDAPLLCIAAVLGVAIAALGLAMAIFSQKLIDEILPQKKFEKLYLGIVLVFLLLLAKEGLSVLRQYFLIKQAQGFNIRIIDFFFNHLLRLPKPFFNSRKIGDMTARLNDTTRIQRVITQLAGNMMIDILAVIVSLAFVFTYSITVGIVCLIVMPVLYFIIYFNNNKIIDGQQKLMGNYAGAEMNYISTLSGIDVVKGDNHQALFQKINNTIYKKYQNAVFDLGCIQIKLSFIINSFGVLFLTGVLSYCSYKVLHAQLKTGELVAILSMCGTMLPSVANLALIMIPVNEARIAFERMFEFTNTPPENEEVGQWNEDFNALHVKNLSFRFPGRKPLLYQISFHVKKGEAVALMGENGCGKSTLVQLLQKNYVFEEGEILINGNVPLSQVNINYWRSLIAVVPQEVHIFNTTVLENIAFEDAATKTNEVLLFLQQLGLAQFMDNLPLSFMTVVGEGGITLSGGQKQMIALARALYRKPRLLILDEATASMDRESELFVLQLLKKVKQEIAIIFITHRLHVLRSFCDRICLLENGTIKSSGTHSHLLQHENLYSKYWKDILEAELINL